MKDVTTSVTSKGQVTIPKAIPGLVGIRPRDRIGFRVEDGVIRIVKQRTVRDVAGTVKPLRKIDDLETMIRDAKKDHFNQRIRRR